MKKLALQTLLIFTFCSHFACQSEPSSQSIPADSTSNAEFKAIAENDKAASQNDALSGVVALQLKPESSFQSITELVKTRVDQLAKGQLPVGTEFPIKNQIYDKLTTLPELKKDLIVKWLDPLTMDETTTGLYFGGQNDYIAYFGDNWNANWAGQQVGQPPQFNGSQTSGWIWVNHETLSDAPLHPGQGVAPFLEYGIFARFLKKIGALHNKIDDPNWSQTDIDTFVDWHRKQTGGSWIRVHKVQDDWQIDRTAANKSYNATSQTRLTITGQNLKSPSHDDDGQPLPKGVVPGIMDDCSGLQTPWGTIFTAEENVQNYYGDLEATWTPQNQMIRGQGFDAGSWVDPTLSASPSGVFGFHSYPTRQHPREFYGYLTEIDPGLVPEHYYNSPLQNGDGQGHRKLGSVGRGRWENAAVAVGKDLQLLPNQKIVLYSADDRTGGRIYKFISKKPYTIGMTKAEIRGLLDDGDLYVAHFQTLDDATGFLNDDGQKPTAHQPGYGQWLHLSVTSLDLAPNGQALGKPQITIGQALQDLNWNQIGGFQNDDDVRRTLFTASNKVGIKELNRPEVIVYNARDISGSAKMYVSFTKHTYTTALDPEGRVWPMDAFAQTAKARTDKVGRVFAIAENNASNPADSKAFQFYEVFEGHQGQGVFDAANPDNLALAEDGTLWMGTDGNYGLNQTADGFYYIDLDPSHQEGAPGITLPTFGKAIRIVAQPSNAEATGLTFLPGGKDAFLSVQHPGEYEVMSSWPFNDEL